MFTVFREKKDIIIMQESKLSEADLRGFLTTAQLKGWNVYHQGGPPTATVLDTRTENGGVLVAVKKELRQKLLKKMTKVRSQLVIVMIEGVEIFAGYCPPDTENRAAMAEMAHEAMLERDCFLTDNIQPKWWLLLGDFNDESPMSPTAEVGKEAHGVVIPKEASQTKGEEEHRSKGSRWTSDRDIDWLMSNRPKNCQGLKYSEVVISDHKVQEFELAVDTPYEFSTGRLQQKPKYPKPERVETDVWRAHLLSVWQEQETSETRQNLQKGLQDETTKVSEEWTTFQKCI